jgi:hypothetical protein
MTVSLDTLSSPTLHNPVSLLDYFTELADPRREQGRIHRLDEIIFILPWHRRSSYEPDAPARGVPQSRRWRVGLVCAKDAKLSSRGNIHLRRHLRRR